MGPAALPDGYRFSRAEPDDVELMRRWAVAEGWNPGIHDLDHAYANEPAAFVTLLRGAELVGGGTIVTHGNSFGFMGMFIVVPEHRGVGLGQLLWHHRLAILLERLGPAPTIGMDGVFAMQAFYERGGFRLSHRDLRFEGRVPAPQWATADAWAVAGSDLTDDEVAAICRLDEREWRIPRSGILRRWLRAPDTVVARVGPDVAPEGCAVIRRCAVGWRFGPIVADGDDAVRALAGAALDGLEGQQVQIDVPEFNAAGRRLVDELGLSVSFGCARMYYGRMPEKPGPRAVGVMSFEFG